MKPRLRGFLAVGLALICVACGSSKTVTTQFPACQFLSAEEAEYIVTRGGERLVEGDIEEAVAQQSGSTVDGRAIWAVYLKAGATELILLHDTASSVEAPSDAGWRDGRWLSYNRATRRVLSFPLNSSRSEPYPTAVLEALLRCTVSGAL